MRAVVQRVTEARVSVDGEIIGEIGRGLVVLLGVGRGDGEKDAAYLAEKIVNLRIFEDAVGKMNLSVQDVNGSLLVVSQFTLYGDCRHGRRPGFDAAAGPEAAQGLYEKFVMRCKDMGMNVQTGKFQAMMLVDLHNDGPVTLLLDSGRLF